MPENEPQPKPRDLFEDYVGLLSDRAELQEAFDAGLADAAIEELYFNEIIRLGESLDALSIEDGFAESLVAGGVRAAAALSQLELPALTRRADPDTLEQRRQPHRTRLEVAASFLYEYGVNDEAALRVQAAARAAGIQLVSQAAFVVVPQSAEAERGSPVQDAQDAGPIVNVAAARHGIAKVAKATLPEVASPAVRNVEVHGEVSMDDYFTLTDAAALMAGLSRFSSLLAQNGIHLPDAGVALYERLDGIDSESGVDAETVLRQRSEAVAKLGRLLQDGDLLDKFLGGLNLADPRAELLLSLKETVNHQNPERFHLLAELVKAQKYLAVTIGTPSRSGPVIYRVESGVDGGTVAEQALSLQSEAAEEPAVLDAHLGYMIDVEPLISRLNSVDRALAALCVDSAFRIRRRADVAGLTDASEAYQASLLSGLLCLPRLQHAAADARKAKIIDRHIQHIRSITVQEAMIVTLYGNPLLKEFIARNGDTVRKIIATVRDAPVVEPTGETK